MSPKGVAESEKLEGVMHVTRMALGTALHSTVANMLYCLTIAKVPRGLMEGIHPAVSRKLVCGSLVLLVGDACNVTGVLDVLRKVDDNEGLTAIFILHHGNTW